MAQNKHAVRNNLIYTDLPLPQGRACIRLLTVLPGRGDDKIRCRLEVVTLSTFRKYEALSYTWGSTNYDFPIEVNSQPFHATTNLGLALLDLRHATKRRKLWVDAVCINQSDLEERASQVREMGSIFRLAEQVVIWLGPGNEQSSQTLQHIRHGGQGTCVLCEPERKSSLVSSGLMDILGREWWRRVWVVQEVALGAGNPLIGCGRTFIPWNTLIHFLGYKQITHAAGIKLVRQALELNTLRQDVKTPPRLRDFSRHNNDLRRLNDDLFQWLRRTALFRASDPRDKLYALLGMIRSSHLGGLKVDYRMSIEDITMQLVVSLVNDKKGLDFMALCQPDSATECSWLPNLLADGLPPLGSFQHEYGWSVAHSDLTHASCRPVVEYGVDCKWNTFMEHLKSWNLPECPEPPRPRSRLSGPSIVALGVKIGCVQEIISDHEASQNTQQKTHQSSIASEIGHHYFRSLLQECRLQWKRFNTEEQAWPRRSNVSQIVQSRQTFIDIKQIVEIWRPAWSEIGVKSWIVDEEAESDAHRSGIVTKYDCLLENGEDFLHGVNRQDHSKAYECNEAEMQRAIYGVRDDFDEDRMKRTLHEIVDDMAGRIQFLTDTGLIGFGPRTLRKEDEIVTFLDSDFAYAVRHPQISENGTPLANHHVLVGPVVVRPPSLANAAGERRRSYKPRREIAIEPREYTLR